MLVLSRKEDESIRIGADVVVTIRKIEGNQVRVAIDAPREVKVLRTELEESSEVREGNNRRRQTAVAGSKELGAKSREQEHGKPGRAPAAA